MWLKPSLRRRQPVTKPMGYLQTVIDFNSGPPIKANLVSDQSEIWTRIEFQMFSTATARTAYLLTDVDQSVALLPLDAISLVIIWRVVTPYERLRNIPFTGTKNW